MGVIACQQYYLDLRVVIVMLGLLAVNLYCLFDWRDVKKTDRRRQLSEHPLAR
tara:strand:- start:200 stop:358 length:159 start_codon:yes stop_codon:yes gene_type:complete